MVKMVAFINLFFAPVICLYLLYQAKGKPMEMRLEMLFQYCIVAACNVPAAKVFVVLIRRFTGKQIALDSGYYTLVALASATLLAWLLTVVRIEIAREEGE